MAIIGKRASEQPWVKVAGLDLQWFLKPDKEGHVAGLHVVPPGWYGFLHSHPCQEFVYIEKGDLTFSDGQKFGAGDVVTTEAGTRYSMTAGPEGSTFWGFSLGMGGISTVVWEADVEGVEEMVAADANE